MKEIEKPLVTVILTAYNQEKYIEKALDSVALQTYPNIQVIVIDNASSDKTSDIIESYRSGSCPFTFIRNQENIGLCKAFNQGLELAKGKYLIDFSGDDLMLPDRIASQVNAFELLSEDYVVVFSNARYVDANGVGQQFHFPVDSSGKALASIPAGDVYKNVLEKYFICTPTMMMNTEIVRKLGGYDESLSFEDFDFWVRSAVRYKYFYQDQILTWKRDTPDSLGTQVYKKGSRILESCYVVCNKAYDLNRDQEEFDLLAARIRTFIRKCLYAQEFDLAIRFRQLLNYIENPGFSTELVVFLCRLRLPVNGIYRFYIKNIHKFFTGRKDLAFTVVNPER